MATEIENGVGNSSKLKVDNKNRAHTQSLSISYEDFAVLNGDSFGVLAPVVTLTTDTISHLIYVSNDNTHDIVVSNVGVGTGQSTGGTNTDWVTTLTINPADGTLISGGADAIEVNNRFGSSKILAITSKTGVQGSTITGGASIENLITGTLRFVLGQKLIIPPGASFSIGLTPPSGNTSAQAQITLTLIKQTLDFE